MSISSAIVVPARLQSTRFPRKLLFEIAGTPLILLTACRIREEAPDLPLFFAVDHEDLESVLVENGFQVIRTREDHTCGTDRITEANRSIQAEHVINVQGDEPLVNREAIYQLKSLIEDPGADLATLAHRFTNPVDFANPNQVKVILDNNGRALYFSRSAIPFHRDQKGVVNAEWLKTAPCFRHLGLYAYKKDFLEAFSQLPAGELESIEKLEQLRALENGYQIAVGITDHVSVGVDTPEDVAVIENYLNA